jgi:hypothetical protein
MNAREPTEVNSPHPASLPADRLRAECEIRFTRRSGPGGQHRNKVETAVILKHRLTGVRAEANERRSQSENLRVALRRLRTGLALQVRCPWHGPSRLWQSRCRQKRLAVSAQHEDFPSLVAEALDALDAVDWNVPQAAENLVCSSSQLVRLLRQERSAFERLNHERRERGARSLS